jgi:hypothetical protein
MLCRAPRCSEASPLVLMWRLEPARSAGNIPERNMRPSTQKWAISRIDPIRESSIAAHYGETIGVWRNSCARA